MLIDAVKLGYTGFAQPVTERPPVDAVFNRYETSSTRTIGSMVLDAFLAGSPTASVADSQKFHDNWEAVVKRGEPAHGASISGMNATLDNEQKLDDTVTHITIDNMKDFSKKSGTYIGISPIQDVIDFAKKHF